jgi:hypothetical protein
MQLKNPSFASIQIRGGSLRRYLSMGGALSFVFAVINSYILNGSVKRKSPIRT